MPFSAAATGTQKTLAIPPCQSFQGYGAWVRGVIHLLGGQRIMTCSSDGLLRVWNLKTGEQIGDAWRDGKNGVLAIALSPDGKKVVCGCADGVVKLWDIDTGKSIAKWTGHTSYVGSVYWNRDHWRVVSASGDGTVRVWDVESGRTILVIETGLSDPGAVIYSPDMTMIATGGNSKDFKESIKIWDAKTGRLVTNLKGHREKVSCLAWTADGSTLVSGSWDYSIRTWNTTTWQQILVLTGHTNAVRGIAISPNGLILASACWDKTAQLWNLENGLPTGSPLQHPLGVECVSFSTDGKLLATGCRDNNAYSWDIAGILKEAGLLNPTDSDNSLNDADATRRPGYRRKDVDRISPRFFEDTPYHPDTSRCRILSSSICQRDLALNPSSHRHSLIGRISSLFLRNHNSTHDALPQRSFLRSVRSIFVHLPHGRNYEGFELQERRLVVANVPFTRGKPRNYSVWELRRKEEKEKQKAKQAQNAKNEKETTNVVQVQQFSGAIQAQPTSQVHAAVSTLSAIPLVAATCPATATTSRPDAMIPRAGRWTCFWLSLGCVSAQYTYTDGYS